MVVEKGGDYSLFFVSEPVRALCGTLCSSASVAIKGPVAPCPRFLKTEIGASWPIKPYTHTHTLAVFLTTAIGPRESKAQAWKTQDYLRDFGFFQAGLGQCHRHSRVKAAGRRQSARGLRRFVAASWLPGPAQMQIEMWRAQLGLQVFQATPSGGLAQIHGLWPPPGPN